MSTPELKILRRLDVDALSPEAVEYFDKFENGPDYVDSARARDYQWTDEIVANTLDFVIADPDGEILAEGFGSIIEAEAALSGAKVTYSIEIPAIADATPPLTGLVGRD
jgi:hypothetical protein